MSWFLQRRRHTPQATAFIARMDADLEAINRQRTAYAAIHPLSIEVRDKIWSAWREGRRPNIVCMGERQQELLWKYAVGCDEIRLPKRIRGLRIVETNDPDLVAVYEERPGGWV